MKTILIILLLCFGFGCRADVKSDPPIVVVIEGCEYFYLPSSHLYYTLCHKGNCTNHQTKVVIP